MLRRSAFAALPLLALAACQSSSPRSDAQAAPRALPVVFFSEDSAAMGPEARAVVADVAERARRRPAEPVAVRGFTAPDGVSGRGFTRALSEARAQTVADALVAGGVARERIRIQPRGNVPFEMMPVESRRVEIHLGG